MKKFLALVLVMVSLVSLVPVALGATDIGWIKYRVSGDNSGTWCYANELEDQNGHRVAFTSARALYPTSKWDTKFTSKQLKAIANTWVDVSIHVPDGAFSRVYCVAWQQSGEEVHTGGYIMDIAPGDYTLKVLNGEAVNWASGSDSSEADLLRIWKEVIDGNINTKPPLKMALVTDNLRDKIPEAYLLYIGITTGPSIDE